MIYVIINFADSETEKLFITGNSKKLPANIINTALKKLDYLNRAETLQDLQAPPGNRLELLKGNLAGNYSIRINDQFRIIFKFKNGDVCDVQIKDYH